MPDRQAASRSQTLLPRKKFYDLGQSKLGLVSTKASRLLYNRRNSKAVLCCASPKDMTPVMLWWFSTPVSHLMHGRKGDEFTTDTCVSDNVRSIAAHRYPTKVLKLGLIPIPSRHSQTWVWSLKIGDLRCHLATLCPKESM